MPAHQSEPSPEGLNTTARVDHWLGRLREGDAAAREELIACAQRRLEAMARKMLRKKFPAVGRLEQTGDVLNESLARLNRALHEVRPETPRQFFGLASEQIRRQLLDFKKHYFGPRGIGKNHQTDPPGPEGGNHGPHVANAPQRAEPSTPDELERLLEQMKLLPALEREVIDHLFIFEHTQAQAAEIIGVSDRTVRERKVAALLHLREALQSRETR